MKEGWKAIPGFDGYFATEDGDIISARFGRPLRPHYSARGYGRVVANGKTHLVHRLVILAFAGPSHLQVNHINGNTGDNRPTNIEYCTHAENQAHSWNVIGRVPNMRGRSGILSKSSKPVEAVAGDGTVERYANAAEAERLGAGRSRSISMCCLGRKASHRGRYWRFIGKSEFKQPTAGENP